MNYKVGDNVFDGNRLATIIEVDRGDTSFMYRIKYYDDGQKKWWHNNGIDNLRRENALDKLAKRYENKSMVI